MDHVKAFGYLLLTLIPMGLFIYAIVRWPLITLGGIFAAVVLGGIVSMYIDFLNYVRGN